MQYANKKPSSPEVNLTMVFMHRSLGYVWMLVIGFALSNSKAAGTALPVPPSHCNNPLLRGCNFPNGFIFGTASAAYQYEGAANEGGRGPSNWDTYSHRHPERIADRSNGDVAVDQYHRYKQDVDIMKSMGWDSYRFSISWSRLLPNGTLSGGINKEGIHYYNNLINEVLSKGLKPFVTLFHWDVPQALEEEFGGFLSRRIVEHFKDFVDLCYWKFGDRVKHWITLNEPNTFSNYGYAFGAHAPGRCSAWQDLDCLGGDSGIEPYLVTHHLLLAHAAAARLYKDKYQAWQKGVIGITVVSYWFEPASEELEDINAASRALDFMFGWFIEAVTNGKYPASMQHLVGNRLPNFREEESKLLIDSCDFLGINYYTGRYASHAPHICSGPPSYVTDSCVNVTTERDGIPIGPQGASDWLFVYPKGIYNLLLYTKNKYKDPVIYITENGIDEFNELGLSLEEALNDTHRIDYYRSHLCYVHEAIKNGTKVQGYFSWSLLDNYEWHNGYTVRFGIIYVNYKNGLQRISKASGRWFKYFLNQAYCPLTEEIPPFVSDSVWETKSVY